MARHRKWQVGDLVELVSTTDSWTRLAPGAVGVVKEVDSLGTVHVNWRDGGVLGMVPGEDEIRLVEGNVPG